MPVRSELVGEILHVTFSGLLTREDLGRVGEQVLEIEGPDGFLHPRLIDISSITAASIGFDAVSRLTDQRRGVTLPNATKSAIVAREPLQLGFARMFQNLNDHPQITVEVFRDRAAVMSWLAVPPAPPAD